MMKMIAAASPLVARWQDLIYQLPTGDTASSVGLQRAKVFNSERSSGSTATKNCRSNVGKTIINQPFGNGKHTTYLW